MVVEPMPCAFGAPGSGLHDVVVALVWRARAVLCASPMSVFANTRSGALARLASVFMVIRQGVAVARRAATTAFTAEHACGGRLSQGQLRCWSAVERAIL